MGLEGAGELGLIVETPTIGDFGGGLDIIRVLQRLPACREALLPYPVAHRLAGILEQFMQVAGGNPARPRNAIRVEPKILQIGAGLGHRRAARISRGIWMRAVAVAELGDHSRFDFKDVDRLLLFAPKMAPLVFLSRAAPA